MSLAPPHNECRPWGVGVTASSGTFFVVLAEKPQAPAKTTACASEMSGQGGGREGGHGRGQSDRSFGSGGRRKGNSHAGPGRPTQSGYRLAKLD